MSSSAAAEIAAFKAEYRHRNPGADLDKITDADLLREVLNTVGKKGLLGEQVRCVVSVGMLNEGWDANTVTHILGVRAFRSQLLCEQVVGRGLRRRSYALDDDGRFAPEYANVYGIPFAFIPSERDTGPLKLPVPAVQVESLPGRDHLRIEFPLLDGYRTEIPDGILEFAPDEASRMTIGADRVPSITVIAPIAGDSDIADGGIRDARSQRVAFEIAARLLRTKFAGGEDSRPWLFPQLLKAARRWLDDCVTFEPGHDMSHLCYRSRRQKPRRSCMTRSRDMTRCGVRDCARSCDGPTPSGPPRTSAS